MNEWQVDALDRVLDRLGGGDQVGAAADQQDTLELLAMVRGTDWPDRAVGDRITEGVAVKLGAEHRGDPTGPVPAVARSDGHAARKVAAAETTRGRSGTRAAKAAGGRERSRRKYRSRAIALVSAAAVIVGGALIAVSIRGGTVSPWRTGGPPQVYRSSFAATVMSGHSQSAGRKLGGGWQLLSYLTTPGWHADVIGTPPDDLSCPTTSVCYMSAARPVPASGPGYLTNPQYNLLDVSRDGGAAWTTLSLPADISITTPLQCPVSATTCYASGYDAQRVVLLATTDGGRTWTARRVPGPANFASALACPADDRCAGLFVEDGSPPGYHQKASDATVLVTRDGGLTWSAGPPTPRGQLPDYLACGGTTCVVFDQLITQDNSQSVNGNGALTVAPGSWAAWYSHDRGSTWQRGQHPAGIWTLASNDLPAAGTISCSDKLHCWAAMSSQIGEPAIATAFAATSDGGAKWVTQSLPVQRAKQFIPLSMSCPTALQCYAAGGDSAGPVILTTRDGGTMWSPVNLPKIGTRHDRQGALMPAIGLIACAAANRCVAAPDDSQSAHRVPIYSLGSS